MTAIFAAMGIGVSASIIAAGGGFSGPVPSILNPPTEKDIWTVGAHIHNGTTLQYTLTGKGPSSSLDSARVSIIFEDAGNEWNVTFVIINGSEQTIERTIPMSKELTREGQLEDSFKPYFETIQSSIFAVRDMDYSGRPKYLVLGAPWDTIFVGASSITVVVSGNETVQTPAGTFDAFVLSYKLKHNISKVWVVRDMPLPVKAEVFDADDNLQYMYELAKASEIQSTRRAV
jgi:hypothetical protein